MTSPRPYLFKCAALSCTQPTACTHLENCRWNVPFSKGGSMSEQPGARQEDKPMKSSEIPTASNPSLTPDPENGVEQNKNVRHTCAPVEQGGLGVGDLNSTAAGSGARYNAGKAPMEMIPVWIVAAGEAWAEQPHLSAETREAWRTLNALGQWQMGALDIGEVMFEAGGGTWAEAAKVFHHVTTRPVKPYPIWNWAKGMPWSVPTACAVRHLLAILRGEHLDPETGLPHRGHVMCNLIMLAQYEKTYPEGDDRPPFLRAVKQ